MNLKNYETLKKLNKVLTKNYWDYRELYCTIV